MSGRKTKFLSKLQSAGRLPTPPGVVAKLLDAAGRGDVTAKEIAEIVAGDPAMAAKVLRFVNSPVAGLQREVTSLQQAVALLGLNSVKMMALSFAVVAPRQSVGCKGFDPVHFAAFSASCGAAAQHLSEVLRIGSAQEAYTAGLLSQYGRFVLASSCPKEYSKVLELNERTPNDLVELEEKTFGTNYAEVGAQILRRWGLPESLCSAIETFRSDPADEKLRPLASIIALAEHAAEVVCSADKSVAAQPHRFIELAASAYDLTPDACSAVLTTIAEEARHSCELLDVPVSKIRSTEELESQVSDRITELTMAMHLENQMLARQQKELHRRATTDALTGVGNRAAFDARLDLELLRAQRSGGCFALLMMDVDHFKRFNDTHGHQAGDRVLKAVAGALEDNVRKVDYVSRYGGEEFAVIAPDSTPDGAAHLAERLRAVVASSIVPWNGLSLAASISIGIASYSSVPQGIVPSDVIRLADEQLYAAKCAGRDCVRLCLNGQSVSVTAGTA